MERLLYCYKELLGFIKKYDFRSLESCGIQAKKYKKTSKCTKLSNGFRWDLFSDIERSEWGNTFDNFLNYKNETYLWGG